MTTFGPTEFLKAIADDIEQVAKKLGRVDRHTPLSSVRFYELELQKIISDIREYTSTKVTTIAGTTVISTTTDESK